VCWRGCSARSANTAKIACAWRWEAAIKQHRSKVPDLAAAEPRIDNVAVPDALAAYVVEAGRASDYDHLLAAGAVHE
jgi:hypothetical protein